MVWYSRITNEWNKAGIIERVSWVIEFGGPMAGISLWFFGLLPKADVFIIVSVIFFILSLVLILLNISMRHARDKSQDDLVLSKQTISDMWDFINDLSEYPYNEGGAVDRQLNSGIRAAIAKNGKIPRNSNVIITRLNEKDTKLGARFEDLDQKLRENGFID